MTDFSNSSGYNETSRKHRKHLENFIFNYSQVCKDAKDKKATRSSSDNGALVFSLAVAENGDDANGRFLNSQLLFYETIIMKQFQITQ